MKPEISPNVMIGIVFLSVGVVFITSIGFPIALPFLMMGFAFMMMGAINAKPSSDRNSPDA